LKKPFKISSEWPRIVGLQADNNGSIAAVWLAHDKQTDRIYLYDTVVFEREVFSAIAERILGKDGKWKDIPISWELSGEEVARKLRERKCKTLFEGYRETPALAEVTAREIWSRMENGLFLVGSHNQRWFDEKDRFWLSDKEVVPMEGFPLMSATRHAMAKIEKARRIGVKPRRIDYDNRGII